MLVNASGLWLNMSRDAGVSCPSLWLARRVAATAPQRHKVWLYSFEFNSTAPGAGVRHGDEVDLVWQRPPANSVDGAATVAYAAGAYWTSFVTHGALMPPASKAWPSWSPFDMNASEASFAFTAAGEGATRHGQYATICEVFELYTSRGAVQQQRFNEFGYLC